MMFEFDASLTNMLLSDSSQLLEVQVTNSTVVGITARSESTSCHNHADYLKWM